MHGRLFSWCKVGLFWAKSSIGLQNKAYHGLVRVSVSERYTPTQTYPMIKEHPSPNRVANSDIKQLLDIWIKSDRVSEKKDFPEIVTGMFTYSRTTENDIAHHNNIIAWWQHLLQNKTIQLQIILPDLIIILSLLPNSISCQAQNTVLKTIFLGTFLKKMVFFLYSPFAFPHSNIESMNYLKWLF